MSLGVFENLKVNYSPNRIRRASPRGCMRSLIVFCFLAFIGKNGHENSKSGTFSIYNL